MKLSRVASERNISVAYFPFLVFLTLLLGGTILASPGDVDATFRSGGFVTSSFGGSASACALQTDGKIILVGRGAPSNFTLMRLNPNGTLDNSFGTNGVITTNVPGDNEIPFDLAIQADGKIVVVGQFQNGGDFQYDFGVIRYNADGSLDTSFGTGGVTSTTIGDREDVASSVVIQNDGKILVGGSVFFFGGPSAGRSGLVRYNANGSLDTTFDGDGKAVVQPNGFGELALQSDGKIVVAGSDGFGSDSNFALSRTNTDGSVDTSFGTLGKVITNFNSGSSGAGSVAILADGKIVAAGSGFGGSGQNDFALARYHADGSLDASFDGDGKVTTSFSSQVESISAIALQPDGKIVAAGYAIIDGAANQMAFARYDSAGTLDPAFGTAGKFTARLYPGRDYAVDVALQPDGKTIIAGSVGGAPVRFAAIRFGPAGELDQSFNSGPPGYSVATDGEINGAFALTIQPDRKIVTAGAASDFGLADFSLARFNADGTADLTFGTGGKARTSVSSSIDGALAVALQPDGKIVAAGYSGIQGFTDVTLVRYRPDGIIDTTFGSNGIVVLSRSGSSEAATGVVIQSDGKIVVGGYSNTSSSFLTFFLARLNTNGSLDPSFDGDGIVSTDVGSGHDFADALLLQPDGKFVAVGTSRTGELDGDFAAVRYNLDGSIDTSFGIGGKAVVPIGTQDDVATAASIQPDGKLILGGNTSDSMTNNFALARLQANGSLDTSFGIGGRTVTSFGNSYLEDVTIQPTGKIVAVGERLSGGGPSDIAVVRFNPGGQLDTTFGAGGIRITDIDNRDFGRAVASQGEDKIIVAGSLYAASQNPPRADLVVLRYFANSKTIFDFDGDGKTDISIFRPGPGEWWYSRSSDGVVRAAQFGSTTDVITPGDFTGDGRTDIAFWRPTTGQWFILRSEDGSFFSFPFGSNGDIPTPADFDADGKTDPAVFRPSTGTWFIPQSGGAGTIITQFGQAGDQPVAADYDGDGKADIGIIRRNAGNLEWWLLRSSAGLFAAVFGGTADKAVPGDYTGDGKTDVAVWRPSGGNWFVLRSEDFSYFSFPFGLEGDVPAPGDYDGDGKFDPTIFRPAVATWFVNRTGGSGVLIAGFGAATDTPVPSAYLR